MAKRGSNLIHIHISISCINKYRFEFRYINWSRMFHHWRQTWMYVYFNVFISVLLNFQWPWGHCMSVHNWQLLYLVCGVGSEVLRIMGIICLVPLSQVNVSLWPWRRKQQVFTSDKSTLTTQWQTFMYFYLLWSPTYKILDLQNCHSKLNTEQNLCFHIILLAYFTGTFTLL